MKRVLLYGFLLVLTAGLALGAAGRFSLKDLKNALKSDSTETGNANLAKQVIEEGVTFEYTAKREGDLRKWGANDVLINAIWQSIVDERDEKSMFERFFEKQASADQETRRAAIDAAERYLSRFEENPRFKENSLKIRKELGFLKCEFDPSLGC